MRKLLIVVLALLMVSPALFARRKKEKSGTITDLVYSDKKFGFSLTLNDDWKYKTQKNESNFRLVLNKINYEIPPDYNNAPDYTYIPRMVVFVGESNLSAPALLDSLLSDSYKSDLKKEILKEFEIFHSGGGSSLKKEKLLPRKRKSTTIDGARGILWTGQVKYRNEVATSAASAGGKRVYGAFGGSVVIVKKDNLVYMFHVMSEWMYLDNTLNDAMKIINSLKFVTDEG